MSEIAATRRGLLLGLGAVLILPAPAIVPARSLMPVKALPPSGWWVIVERLNPDGLVTSRWREAVQGSFGRVDAGSRPLSLLLPPNRDSPWGGTRLTLEHGDYLPRGIPDRAKFFAGPASFLGPYPGDGWASASL